jgi:hypothetical protein
VALDLVCLGCCCGWAVHVAAYRQPKDDKEDDDDDDDD